MSLQELSLYKAKLEQSPNNTTLVDEYLSFVRDQQVRESALVLKYGKKIIQSKSALGDNSMYREYYYCR